MKSLCWTRIFRVVVILIFMTCSVSMMSINHSYSFLIIHNKTEFSVRVYINNEFVLDCDPFMKYIAKTTRQGNIWISGYLRCDMWGPDKITLQHNKIATWNIAPKLKLDERLISNQLVAGSIPVGADYYPRSSNGRASHF